MEQSHATVPWVEGGSAGKDFGILVDKLNVSRQRVLAAKKVNCTVSLL